MSPPKQVAAVLVTAPPPGQTPDDAAMTRIDGRESALRAMELLTNRDPITQLVLTIDPAAAEEVKRKAGSHLVFLGVKLVTAGGGWYGQLAGALPKLDPAVTHVLVHDAGRPAVPYTDLEALLAADAPAAALAIPLRGTIAEAASVPGPGTLTTARLAKVLTPRLYDRTAFETLCKTQAEPVLALVDGSPLNVRCGEVPPGVVKAMIALLPKPKVAASNPFEEAQW